MLFLVYPYNPFVDNKNPFLSIRFSYHTGPIYLHAACTDKPHWLRYGASLWLKNHLFTLDLFIQTSHSERQQTLLVQNFMSGLMRRDPYT